MFSRLCSVGVRQSNHFTRGNSSILHKHGASLSVCLPSNDKRDMSSSSIYTSMVQSSPVQMCEQLLSELHAITHLPWWCSIMVTTIAMRSLCTFPLAVYQNIIMARLANLGPEVKQMNEDLKREAVIAKHKLNLTEKQAILLYKRSLKRRTSELIERDNCHPLKTTVVMWAQIPLWVSMSFAIRDLTTQAEMGVLACQSLKFEGTLWFSDLCSGDPYFIIPILVGVLNYANIELYSLRNTGPVTKFNRITSNIFKGLSVLMIPIAAVTPTAVTLYWLTSAMTAMSQSLLLMSPELRRTLRIPRSVQEQDKPYQIVLDNFRKKYMKES